MSEFDEKVELPVINGIASLICGTILLIASLMVMLAYNEILQTSLYQDSIEVDKTQIDTGGMLSIIGIVLSGLVMIFSIVLLPLLASETTTEKTKKSLYVALSSISLFFIIAASVIVSIALWYVYDSTVIGNVQVAPAEVLNYETAAWILSAFGLLTIIAFQLPTFIFSLTEGTDRRLSYPMDRRLPYSKDRDVSYPMDRRLSYPNERDFSDPMDRYRSHPDERDVSDPMNDFAL